MPFEINSDYRIVFCVCMFEFMPLLVFILMKYKIIKTLLFVYLFSKITRHPQHVLTFCMVIRMNHCLSTGDVWLCGVK